MKKKILFLFLALALPGLVFVFLKKFGKNEFGIPVFFEHASDSLNTVCGTHYPQPYAVPDSVLQKTGVVSGKPALFVLEATVLEDSEFKRLGETFETSEFQVLEITPAKFGATVFDRWSTCVLMVKPKANVVLIDTEKRIRGYYRIGTREETDRLIVELQILLKHY